MSDEGDLLPQVQRYRDLVLRYEALDEAIDTLIMRHGGKSDNMPAADLKRYRDLARERDDVLNEMRALERLLDLGES